MSNNLLYFPYIDIPQNNWTVKSILYWDNVSIIAPFDYMSRPNQYKQFTIDLLQTGLINQVVPENYTRQVKKFDEAFITLISQRHFNLDKRQAAFEKGKRSRIHIEKLGRGLMSKLVQMRIAAQQDWMWFDVESRTARLLMVYLATVIGKVGDFTPATDDIKNLDISLSQLTFSFKQQAIRQRLIDDLIPYPVSPNLIKLRRFKDKYHQELSSFRILLEKVAFEIATINAPKKQDEKHSLVLAEIADKRAKILSDLNQSRFGQITFGTVCGLTGGLIGVAHDNSPLALFSFGNAVYSALQGYDNTSIRTKDFAYLALIDKHLR